VTHLTGPEPSTNLCLSAVLPCPRAARTWSSRRQLKTRSRSATLKVTCAGFCEDYHEADPHRLAGRSFSALERCPPALADWAWTHLSAVRISSNEGPLARHFERGIHRARDTTSTARWLRDTSRPLARWFAVSWRGAGIRGPAPCWGRLRTYAQAAAGRTSRPPSLAIEQPASSCSQRGTCGHSSGVPGRPTCFRGIFSAMTSIIPATCSGENPFEIRCSCLDQPWVPGAARWLATRLPPPASRLPRR